MDPMITVALVDDYDVVLLGLARMLDGYRDRVRVVEIDANEAVEDVVDIVLYDSFAPGSSVEVGVSEGVRDDVSGRWCAVRIGRSTAGSGWRSVAGHPRAPGRGRAPRSP